MEEMGTITLILKEHNIFYSLRIWFLLSTTNLSRRITFSELILLIHFVAKVSEIVPSSVDPWHSTFSIHWPTLRPCVF